jgi:hypothetical protein
VYVLRDGQERLASAHFRSISLSSSFSAAQKLLESKGRGRRAGANAFAVLEAAAVGVPVTLFSSSWLVGSPASSWRR